MRFSYRKRLKPRSEALRTRHFLIASLFVLAIHNTIRERM